MIKKLAIIMLMGFVMGCSRYTTQFEGGLAIKQLWPNCQYELVWHNGRLLGETDCWLVKDGDKVFYVKTTDCWSSNDYVIMATVDRVCFGQSVTNPVPVHHDGSRWMWVDVKLNGESVPADINKKVILENKLTN